MYDYLEVPTVIHIAALRYGCFGYDISQTVPTSLYRIGTLCVWLFLRRVRAYLVYNAPPVILCSRRQINGGRGQQMDHGDLVACIVDKPQHLRHDAGELLCVVVTEQLLLDLSHVVERDQQDGRVQIGAHGQLSGDRIHRQGLIQAATTIHSRMEDALEVKGQGEIVQDNDGRYCVLLRVIMVTVRVL